MYNFMQVTIEVQLFANEKRSRYCKNVESRAILAISVRMGYALDEKCIMNFWCM